jgi:hypothetical protein
VVKTVLGSISEDRSLPNSARLDVLCQAIDSVADTVRDVRLRDFHDRSLSRGHPRSSVARRGRQLEFALVDCSLDDFEDFLPLDYLNGVLFFIKELSDEGPADAIAFILKAIDLDAVLQSLIAGLERPNRAVTSAQAARRTFARSIVPERTVSTR